MSTVEPLVVNCVVGTKLVVVHAVGPLVSTRAPPGTVAMGETSLSSTPCPLKCVVQLATCGGRSYPRCPLTVPTTPTLITLNTPVSGRRTYTLPARLAVVKPTLWPCLRANIHCK